MVPDPAYCCYGLEYFCFENDGLWNMADADLIALASSELEKIGLARATDVTDGCVIRQIKAYPVYDDQYATHVAAVPRRSRRALSQSSPGGPQRDAQVQQSGSRHDDRHAHGSNILAGEKLYDVWEVNQDAEYHESGASGERMVPVRVGNINRNG